MKKTQIGRFSSRLAMATSMASIVLLGCCQGLLAAPSGHPSKKEILKAAPGEFDYLFLNKYPVHPSPLVERFDIKGKTPSVDKYSRRTVICSPVLLSVTVTVCSFIYLFPVKSCCLQLHTYPASYPDSL